MTFNKGDIIQLDGKNYRIIKRDGTIAEVVQLVASNSYSTAFASSATMVYEGSTLDTYLNTTFYNSLSAEVRAAIVPKNIVQDIWASNNSYERVTEGKYGSSNPGTSSYTISQRMAKYGNSLTRNCYALSILDILEYVLDSVVTDGLLQNYNIWGLFWNQNTKPSTDRSVWLRSSSLNTTNNHYIYVASGSNGRIQDKTYSSSNSALPAFQIDLSALYSDTAIVDTIALNGNLSSVANSVRNKTNGYNSMAFPNGFVSEINNLAVARGNKVSVTADYDISEGATVCITSVGSRVDLDAKSYEYTQRVAWSPDGTKFVKTGQISSGGGVFYDATVIPYQPIQSLLYYCYGNSGNPWSHDSRYCVIQTAVVGGRWQVFDSQKPSSMIYLEDPGDAYKGCCFSPDDSRLYIYGTVVVEYDTSTSPFTKIGTVSWPSGTVYHMEFNHAGTRLAVVYDSSTLGRFAVYDVTTSPYTRLPDPSVMPTTTTYNASWSYDDTMLAIGCNPPSSKPLVYDVVNDAYTRLDADRTVSTGGYVTWGHTKNILVSVSIREVKYGLVLALWDYSGGTGVRVKSFGYVSFGSAVEPIDISPDDKFVATSEFVPGTSFYAFSLVAQHSFKQSRAFNGTAYGISALPISAGNTGEVTEVLPAWSGY